MFFIWSRVMYRISFAGLTMTAMPSCATGVMTKPGYFAFSSAVTSREVIPMSTVFAPIAWIPTPDPPPDIWISAVAWVAMYWSAAFWMMGRTVVEPLILMVCRSPDDRSRGSGRDRGCRGRYSGNSPAMWPARLSRQALWSRL